MSLSRPTCYRCFRPLGHCYCATLPRIDNRTEIIILQHPRERFHPIGTARLAELALSRVRVLVDHERRFTSGREPLPLPEGCALLYPKAPCRPLTELAPHERPQHLLVLDGTWHHARALFREHPGISSLPRYSLAPSEPSQYRIRREPQRDFVSTLEAIALSLVALEPETECVPELLAAFSGMIDRQIAARDGAQNRRTLARRRPRAARAFPQALAEHFDRLVLLHVERTETTATHPTELLQCSAVRLATGELFEQLLRPRELPNPVDLTRLGLAARDFDEALDRRRFRNALLEFTRSDDVFAAWHPATFTALREVCPELQSGISLKAAYRKLDRGGGPLRTVLEAEAIVPSPLPLRGKSAERLSQARALAVWLHQLSTR